MAEPISATARPAARPDLIIASEARPEGVAWRVQVPGRLKVFWFGPQEIGVLKALDGHTAADAVARGLGATTDGGESGVRHLIDAFRAVGLLVDTEPAAQRAAQQTWANEAEAGFWGQLLPKELPTVLDRLGGSPGAAADCHDCELTCCTYSVSIGEEEFDALVAAAAEEGIHKRDIFDGGERTPHGKLFRLARDNGHCTLLDADRLCRVHRAGGFDAKPVVCRLFPGRPLMTPDGPRTSLRPGCTRPRLETSPEAVAARAQLLSYSARVRPRLVVPCAPSRIELDATHQITWADWVAFEAIAEAALDGSKTTAHGLASAIGELATQHKLEVAPLPEGRREQLLGSLASLLAEIRGPVAGEALERVARSQPPPEPRRCPPSGVLNAITSLYPLQLPSALAGLGLLRVIVATIDHHPESATHPLEVSAAMFRGFRSPRVHLSLAQVHMPTLEALGILTPTLHI